MDSQLPADAFDDPDDERSAEQIQADYQRILDMHYGGVLPTAKQLLEDFWLMKDERKQNSTLN